MAVRNLVSPSVVKDERHGNWNVCVRGRQVIATADTEDEAREAARLFECALDEAFPIDGLAPGCKGVGIERVDE